MDLANSVAVRKVRMNLQAKTGVFGVPDSTLSICIKTRDVCLLFLQHSLESSTFFVFRNRSFRSLLTTMRFSTVAILFSTAALASANTLWACQNLPGEYDIVLVCYCT